MSNNASSSSSTLDALECPVCLLIPRKKIFQCVNGHSICDICIMKVQVCPTCRVELSGSNTAKIRNHYAENFLDSMTFLCGWKDQGCQLLLRRNQLSHHETTCKYGLLNLCQCFSPSLNCSFQFSSISLRNPGKIDEVLGHMKSAHEYVVPPPLPWNETYVLKLSQRQLRCVKGLDEVKKSFEPIFLQVVDINTSNSSSEVFVLICNLKRDCYMQVWFSLAFVMLTSQVAETNLNVKINLSIKAQKNSKGSESWYEECVPDLLYTFKPMSVPKLKECLEIPVLLRSSFPLTMPISQINKYYVDNHGTFCVEYSFQKE